MTPDNFFITRKPLNEFLSSIVDYYFHINVPVSQLSLKPEFIIPFPRITFGYFFNHPFTATNLTLNESVSVNMAISRISTHKIVVQPQTQTVKIIGAHARPFCLAFLTMQSIKAMPWLINAKDLFQNTAEEFQRRVERCSDAEQMFNEVEKVFLDHILVRDLSLITTAIELIEKSSGSMKISELSAQLGVSDRTLRNQFYDCIGCSPKEYIRLVKLQQVAFQMKHSGKSLTHITYDNNYFDQAHFIHEVKSITGRSPNELRKEIPHFRFLQF
jgi:AraC-like DNA-binding protein